MISDWSFIQGGPEEDPSNEFEVGQQFKNKEKVMLAVKQYSIRKAAEYKIAESDQLRVLPCTMVASSKSSFLIEKDENNHTLGGRKRDSSVTFKIEALYSQEILNSELERVGAEFVGTFMLIFAGTAVGIINEKTNGLVGAEFIGTFIYADFCQNSGGNNEREDQLIGNSYGLRCRHRPCGDGDHPVHRTHIRCSSEPCGHHLLCCLKALSMEEGANVYWNTDIGISVCRICTEGVYHPFMGGGVTVPSGGYGQAFTLEFIISFNLMFVVTVFATDTRTVGQFAGMAVGATVTFNILIAGYVLLSK
ncbi:probable aquaporin NIP5-1 [Arachis hypogaea]|uniref:probable aquaporin NIP5-1 n=1 Tax=Arachis hypogaea TaxID=3818 RepID=UPI003B21E83E